LKIPGAFSQGGANGALERFALGFFLRAPSGL